MSPAVRSGLHVILSAGARPPPVHEPSISFWPTRDLVSRRTTQPIHEPTCSLWPTHDVINRRTTPPIHEPSSTFWLTPDIIRSRSCMCMCVCSVRRSCSSLMLPSAGNALRCWTARIARFAAARVHARADPNVALVCVHHHYSPNAE